MPIPGVPEPRPAPNHSPAAVPVFPATPRRETLFTLGPLPVTLPPHVIAQLNANLEAIQALSYPLTPCSLRARIRRLAHLVHNALDERVLVPNCQLPARLHLVRLAAWCLVAIDPATFDTPPPPDSAALET